MIDHRVEALAQILVGYSTKVKTGDVCSIAASTAAEPLVQAVYEEILRAGGLPVMQLQPSGAQAAFFELAGDEQLDWVAPTTEWAAENSYRWSLTLFPTHAYASEAGMSLPAYEDFYYAACLAVDGDPVNAWERQSDQTCRLTEWIQGREEVRIQAEGTDITLGVAGRSWVPCVGEHNMPDGEFFTGPVEDSVNGDIRFSFPASYGGRTVSGVCLRFEDGKVVEATAEQGEDFLHEMLDADDGARRLGELGIGTNFGIATGTKEILLDEKIGGTVHMAVG